MHIALTTLPILWFLLLPSFGFSQELRCPNLPNVEVSSDDKEGIVEICLAANKAIIFLSRYNLESSAQNPL